MSTFCVCYLFKFFTRFIFCESTDDYKPMEHDESGMNEEERRRELLKQISFHELVSTLLLFPYLLNSVGFATF